MGKAEIAKLKGAAQNQQPSSSSKSINNAEFQKLYHTISLGLSRSSDHADELKSLRQKIVAMQQQSEQQQGAVANQNNIIQKQSKVIYNSSMMEACEKKFKDKIQNLESELKEAKVQKDGITSVKNSDLTSLRTQIVAAIQTCEQNNTAIQNLKSEV